MTSVLLIVLDGYGIAPPGPGNAVYLAHPTTIINLQNTYPHTTLKASGQSVGLPPNEAGNTEVGHINLGAGRVIYQDLPRINMAIADGTFFKNDAFLKVIDHLKQTNGALHLLGLMGQGEVHSSFDHLIALLFFAKEHKIDKVFIHAITDGRDSPPKSASVTLELLEERLKSTGIGKIATVMGRYYAMDRDRRWERTEKAYCALTCGSPVSAQSAQQVITNSYAKDVTDEFIEPTTLTDENNHHLGTVNEGDAVIFFNFRIDRPRQLTKAFVLDDFEQNANITTSFDPYAVKYFKSHLPKEEIVTQPFHRGEKIKNLLFVTMTEYEKNLPVSVAFPPIRVEMNLGRIISEAGFLQLRMSESEKERFVTFYFSGQRDTPYQGEERLIIPSPKVPTYDLKPDMSAHELTNDLLTKMREQKYQFILVNFANPDMVGHTGNIQATIQSIQTIDECLLRITQAAPDLNYSVVITADHGNAEQKINPQTGDISTEHTTNSVPFIVVDKRFMGKPINLQSGILADVAPTVLALLGVNKPTAMTGRNLLDEIRNLGSANLL